ncbi:23S rRNA (guanosine(2251)-2'-O)-methyltransferase RlmB [Betaproteobacteria bacterium]|nr:23S rRNA (guanosine(2251)-2'-O)-methyltransferase RlmB [Betaproteobacteria bacterium]
MILAGYHAIVTRFKIAPKSISKLFVVERRNDLKVKQLFELAKKNNVQVIRVSSLEITRLTMNKKNRVCAAFVEQLTKPTCLEELFDFFRIQGSTKSPIIFLDGVTDPRNLGAIFRNVDATGFGNIVVPMDNSAPLSELVINTACGAVDTVNYIPVKNIARALEFVQDKGYLVYGLDGEAGKSIFSTNFSLPMALVFGDEGKGLRKLTKEYCDELISIPMLGKLESLNVSVACGVTLFEVVRQLQASSKL